MTTPTKEERVTLAPGLRRACVVLLLFLQAVLLFDVARRTGCTTDEHHYFNSGRILTQHGFVHFGTMLQGPVALRANQLFVDEFPRGGFDSAAEGADELLLRGRLPTLLFALPAAFLVYAWARRLFGDVGGLFALASTSLHPVWLAHGGLLLVDTQHASLLLLALFLLARHLERPAPARLALFAAVAALATATKFLAVLALVPAALLAFGASLRHAPRGRRAGAAFVAGLLLVGVGLGTLQACYLPGSSVHVPPEPFASARLAAAAASPILAPLLALLPGPLLEGVDYQLVQSERTWHVFLEGEFVPGSVLYFPCVFLRRTPELLLVLLVPALVLVRRARVRTDLVALGVPLLALAGYLGGGTSMQPGLRYLLVLVPVGCLLLGALGTWRGFERAPGRALVAAGAAAALLALDLARNGPDWLAYFNASSGGQARAFRHFRDTNSDFGQHSGGLEAWLAGFGPGTVTPLGPRAGGRFGRVAVRTLWLGRHSKDTGESELEWVLAGEPRGHLGASWYVFDVSRESLAAALERRESAVLRRALAVALLAEGERAEAARVAAGLRLLPRDPLRKLLAADDLAQPALRALWFAAGREDLAGEDFDPEQGLEGDGPLFRRALERREDHLRYEQWLE